MNEELFHKFGEALDLLEDVVLHDSDSIGIKEEYKAINKYYYDVKAEYGYKDNQDVDYETLYLKED